MGLVSWSQAVARASGGGATSRVPWTLAHIYEIPGGAVAGDYGFVGAVPFVLRALTLPVLGEVLRWVMAADAAATITPLCHAVGTEDAAGLAAQGWTVATTGGTPGTVTTDGTDIVLATTAASSSARITSTATIAAGTQVRVIAELRADTPGTGDLAYIAIGTGSGGSQASLYYGPTVSTALQFPDQSANPLYASHAYRGGPVALPGVASAHALLTMQDDGASVGLVTTLGGQPYCNSRRLASGAGGTVVFNPNGVSFATSPGGAGNGNILRVRRCLVYTV